MPYMEYMVKTFDPEAGMHGSSQSRSSRPGGAVHACAEPAKGAKGTGTGAAVEYGSGRGSLADAAAAGDITHF